MQCYAENSTVVIRQTIIKYIPGNKWTIFSVQISETWWKRALSQRDSIHDVLFSPASISNVRMKFVCHSIKREHPKPKVIRLLIWEHFVYCEYIVMRIHGKMIFTCTHCVIFWNVIHVIILECFFFSSLINFSLTWFSAVCVKLQQYVHSDWYEGLLLFQNNALS